MEEQNLGQSLRRATIEGNLEGTKTLLEQGVNVDAADGYGWTPLMLAFNAPGTDGHLLMTPVRNVNLEMAALLIEHDANVNLGAWNSTALTLAKSELATAQQEQENDTVKANRAQVLILWLYAAGAQE